MIWTLSYNVDFLIAGHLHVWIELSVTSDLQWYFTGVRYFINISRIQMYIVQNEKKPVIYMIVIQNGGGEKNSEVSGFFSILKQFLFSILNYSQDILKFFRLLWIHVPFVILYVFYCLNPVTTIYTIYSPPLPPLELERILDCIIFINTVKPVLCDLSREQSNMVT